MKTAQFRISEGGADPETALEARDTAEKLDEYRWGVSSRGQETVLQEIANADFDSDGIEEILVFLVSSPSGGTAVVSQIALLEKDDSAAPVSLTLQTFSP